MQYIHDFKITVREYYQNGQSNDFPVFSICPMCNAHITLEKHGFYQRYAIISNKSYYIDIRRYYCSCCEKTLSILPSLLLPHFQYSLEVIMQCLKEFFQAKRNHIPFYRQLTEFYSRRFLKNIPRHISFFRDSTGPAVFSTDKYNKAIKLLEMINSFPKETFAKRFFDHYLTSFMAV